MLIRRVSRMKNLLKRQLHHQAYKRWKHQRELFLIPRRLRVRGLPMIRQRPRINLKRVQRTSTMLRRKMSLQETEKRSLQCSTNFLKKRKINLLSRANKLTKRHQLNSTNTWMKQTTSILAKRKRRKWEEPLRRKLPMMTMSMAMSNKMIAEKVFRKDQMTLQKWFMSTRTQKIVEFQMLNRMKLPRKMKVTLPRKDKMNTSHKDSWSSSQIKPKLLLWKPIMSHAILMEKTSARSRSKFRRGN